jgi:hypothetical protein
MKNRQSSSASSENLATTPSKYNAMKINQQGKGGQMEMVRSSWGMEGRIVGLGGRIESAIEVAQELLLVLMPHATCLTRLSRAPNDRV